MKKKNYSDVQLFSLRAIVQACSRSFLSWKPLLLLVGLLTSLQTFAYVNGDKKEIGGNLYIVTDAAKYHVDVIGSKNSGAVVIPSHVDFDADSRFTVVGAGEGGWSAYSASITSLTLPNTCREIKTNAFLGLRGLRTLHIPKSVVKIAKFFFQLLDVLEAVEVDPNNPSFTSDQGVLYNKTKEYLYLYPAAKNVGASGKYIIPEGVKIIGDNAFEWNNSLKELVIAASMTTIEPRWRSVVANCRNLSKISVQTGSNHFIEADGVLYNKDKTVLFVYPEGRTATSYTVLPTCREIKRVGIASRYLQSLNLNNVATLDWGSISFCPKLTTITLPTALTELPEGSVRYCENLTNYEVAAGHEHLQSINGVLYSKDGSTIVKYPQARADAAYTIEPNTKIIGAGAFTHSKIKTLTIPSTVTEIQSYAINASLIEKIVFSGKSQLKVIGANSFMDASKLTSITIPASVTHIHSKAFAICKNLATVTVEAGSSLTSIGSLAFERCQKLTTFTFAGSSNVTSIGERAFEGAALLQSLVMPEKLETIGRGAFRGCKALTTVTFPTNSVIKTIGTGAFANAGLTSVTLPSSIERLEAEAFVGCTGIKKVTLGAKASFVDPTAFKSCSNLKEFAVDPTNTTFSEVKGMLFSKAKNKLIMFPPAQAEGVVLLPPSLTEIGDYAFYDNPNLTNVTIPQKVTKIGNRAFGLCTGLTFINFLTDDMIDPANIAQDLNHAAFDDGVTGSVNQYAKIAISVRNNVLSKYQNNPYYKKFKSIESSFTLPYYLPDGKTQAGTCEYISATDADVTLLRANVTGVETFVADKVQVKPGVWKKVSLIGDYAFEGSTVKEVVLKSDQLEYVGAMAFITKITRTGAVVKPAGTTITNVFFCSNKPPKLLGAKDYELSADFNEFSNTQNIYVKKSKQSLFLNEPTWADYKNRGQIKYQIPGPTIANSYISFSREFDVDLEDGATNRDIHAFVGGKAGVVAGDGDAGATTLKKVSFTSINVAGQGTYIPANTGVIIKNISKNATKTFKYRIGEKDNKTYTVPNNMLKPVTGKAKTLTASAANYYVLQQGIFRFINKTKTPTATIPVHKAYLELKAGSAAGDLYLHFEGDDDLTTGVEAVEVETTTRAPYYRLDGTRVVAPGRGLYIHNGKKVFLNK